MNITTLAILILFSYVPLSGTEFSKQLLVGSHAQRIKNESIMAYGNIGKIKIYHDDGIFKVEQNKTISAVASYDTDPFLRKINSDQLHAFLEQGALKVKQLSNGDFKVDAYNPALGGFLVTGAVVYQGCRIVGYTGLVLGSGGSLVTAFVTTGPAGFLVAASKVIAVSKPAMAAIEAGSLTLGTLASWIPWLP